MAGVQNFIDLHFWQRARQWSKAIFQLTRRMPFSADRRLVEQINDSSESVGANIAEGFGRGTQAEFVQFLGYANGSLNETQSHLCAAYDREYITKDEFGELFQEGTEIRKMMIGFIASMVKSGSGVKHMHKTLSWSEECWQWYERITGRERPEMFQPKGEDEGSEGNSRSATFQPPSGDASHLPQGKGAEQGGQGKPHPVMFQAPNGAEREENDATPGTSRETRDAEY
jgi:four helix bundle protein